MRTIPTIKDLPPGDLADAALLLARSMHDNPLHQRVFGPCTARMDQLLTSSFSRVLRRQLQNGRVLAAYDADGLAGVGAMYGPGHCLPDWGEKLAMLPALVRSGCVSRLPHIHRWLRAWARHDPQHVHCHMGPGAVRRDRRHLGIGTQLMQTLLAHVDALGVPAYLETDKIANVRLYQRHGFQIVGRQYVLGVRNWFMLRP